MRPAFAHSRVVAALIVALVHMGLLWGLMSLRQQPNEPSAVRSTVSLIQAPRAQEARRTPNAASPRTPVTAVRSTVPRAATEPAFTNQQPASPGAETTSTLVTGPPSAAPAASSLNLALPKDSVAPNGTAGLAQMMRTDPRANSPHTTTAERLMGGTGATQVIELVGGGKKIIGPQGECLIVTPNTWGSMNPMDPNARSGPSKVSDCSQLERGARRHARPP